MSHVLAAGALVVEVAPALGGGIARFETGGVPVFRRSAGAARPPQSLHDLACYPLVPFSNRIAHARLAVGGDTIELLRLPEQGEHPMHGIGWQRPWTVAESGPTRLSLTHIHAADAHWPFSYAAAQTFDLDAAALTVTLAVSNRDTRAMPAGIGLHPFLPATPRATLTALLGEFWHADADILPSRRETLPSDLDFGGGRVLAHTRLDHCFGGWSGRATVAWPEHALALDIEASTAFRVLVIYTPADSEFFCVEPVSHLNNGFQLAAAGVAGTGVQLLAPGESLSGHVRFALRALGNG